VNTQSEIYKITFNQLSNNYKLIIREINSTNYCEIDVMSHDAKNIALSKEGISSSRLKTYDLILNCFNVMNIKIDKVIISKKNNFITSKIVLVIDNQKKVLESNFIDSIILSLKTFSVLLINNKLFKEDKDLIYENLKFVDLSNNSLKLLGSNDRVERLKKTLNRLIEKENYESAAIIRDRIDKILKK